MKKAILASTDIQKKPLNVISITPTPAKTFVIYLIVFTFFFNKILINMFYILIILKNKI